MKKQTLLIAILFALGSKPGFAQSSETIRKYIETFRDVAIAEEIRTGVPAAITLAQGIHETGAGTSDLVLKSNNHFGIKCKTEWTGGKVYHDDDARGECFRKYNDPLESYRDHSDFLKNRPYYTSLFQLDPTDYKAWAYGLKKAGYATNPKYPQILIKLIEDYNLQDYTLMALNRKPNSSDIAFASKKEGSEGVDEKTEAAEPVLVRANYPSGVFKINETHVIFVSSGTSFLVVANENRISLSRLFEFNDMKPVDVAERDCLIYLQRKRKVGATEFHFVKAGETIHDIAQLEGIRMEKLMDYNFLRPGMTPMPGERLFLQTKAPAMPRLVSASLPVSREAISLDRPTAPAPAVETNYILHTVQPKETVYAIAKKYDVAMHEVLNWNGLNTHDLKTGQQLRINKKWTDAGN